MSIRTVRLSKKTLQLPDIPPNAPARGEITLAAEKNAAVEPKIKVAFKKPIVLAKKTYPRD